MAHQITHIVLSEKIADSLFVNHDRKAFLIGAVFPDIRYLKVIERDASHSYGLTFKDIEAEKNSFLAGMKYHSLTDEVRENFVVSRKAYDLLPPSKYLVAALKCYEDEVLYSTVSNWQEIIESLDTILPDEVALVNDESKVTLWHQMLKDYFKQAPTSESQDAFALNLGLPKEGLDGVNQIVAKMREIPAFREIVIDMHSNWKSLVDNA